MFLSIKANIECIDPRNICDRSIQSVQDARGVATPEALSFLKA
jgi:hypothetical protein